MRDGEEQCALTLNVVQRAGLTPAEVWSHYVGLGGGVDEFEFNAYLCGVLPVPVVERDAITQAVNELYDDIWRSGRAPYSDELNPRRRNDR